MSQYSEKVLSFCPLLKQVIMQEKGYRINFSIFSIVLIKYKRKPFRYLYGFSAGQSWQITGNVPSTMLNIENTVTNKILAVYEKIDNEQKNNISCVRWREALWIENQIQVVGSFEVVLVISCGMLKKGSSGKVVAEQRPKKIRECTT